ncbi:ATP-grasp domain-containing protein [Sorangium sp. So ce291]|uniref:ATP-grasp domain-containing protein n=1 Tax=Sorangium sp. So ce291 TaxID=3133294 RepID=UPI003F60BE3F
MGGGYWDEAEYAAETAPAAELRALAARVKSRFLTIDVAELLHGGWTIIEVGDGQVSELPDHADRRAFYQELAARLG